MTHRLAVSTLLLVYLGTASALAFADDICTCKKASEPPAASNYLNIGVPSISASRITQDETAVVQSYVNSQLTAYGLSEEQFLALTPAQQRQVLAPGRVFQLTREARRAIVPKKISVPVSVLKQLQPGEQLSAAVIDQYAVALPASVVAESGVALKTAKQRVVIGNQLVVLDTVGRIQDMAPVFAQ